VKVTGIVWMGIRSAAYPELRHLLGFTLGLETVHEARGVSWFSLPDGGEIQIYDDTDVDHGFFGPGPVIGFEVDAFDEAIAELEAAGVRLIGDGDSSGERRWQHFAGPDGNVYEIIGPIA
jgi:catechol 2,3-dioxygenase-like lactoylglutathione lyase family enzyme